MMPGKETKIDQQIVIYTKCCVPQIENWLQGNLTIMAVIFIGIALLPIWGMCLVQDLLRDVEAVRTNCTASAISASRHWTDADFLTVRVPS